MKFTIAIALVLTALPSLSLLAQQAAETQPANDSAKVTYASAAGGFGDLAFAHAYEMSSVTCELEGKLDSKTAKVGDRVVVKTINKAQTSDGTVIPRGARLVGHVTEVQVYDEQHGPARIAIAFDHAELKNGQSIAVHTLIRGVNPSSNAMAASQMNDGNMMGMLPPPAGIADNSRMRPDPGVPGAATNPVDRASDVDLSARNRVDANPDSKELPTVQPGSSIPDTGAHGVSVARAVPHPTGIPGVMLAGNSSSSGVLLGSRQNIRIESGAQIELGVVADR